MPAIGNHGLSMATPFEASLILGLELARVERVPGTR
jgi:hypothetical protein